MGLFSLLAGGGGEISHGYKDKGLLIHLLADGNGHPLAATTTNAKGNERTEVEKLLNKISPLMPKSTLGTGMTVFEADRGYDYWLAPSTLKAQYIPLYSLQKNAR